MFYFLFWTALIIDPCLADYGFGLPLFWNKLLLLDPLSPVCVCDIPLLDYAFEFSQLAVISVPLFPLPFVCTLHTLAPLLL